MQDLLSAAKLIKKLFFFGSREGNLRLFIAEHHSWTESFAKILRKIEMPGIHLEKDLFK